VPATVELIPALAKHVDFFSVGSNDLTQYILAVDKDNPKVAKYYDGLHPAVLLTLKCMVDLAHQAHRPISICGELASDPMALPLLLAMGFDSLSMNASGFLRIKYVLCQIKLTEAKALLAQVLTCTDARQVRISIETW
jgi:phosphotransferase system enzyme I (PtsP)